MRALHRILVAATMASLLIFTLAGVASADLTGKSILTESGECLPGGSSGTPPCTAAVYGPNGFSGQLFFEAAEIGTSQTLHDYICVHTPGGASFDSFGGTYTFSLSEGGAPLGSSVETVTDGVDCTDALDAVTAGGVTITVPADGSVDYTLSIAGITPGTSAQTAFADFNSILNRAIEVDGNQVHSVSVPPPTTFIIPEAPYAILLVLTAGLGAAWFVSRRMQGSRSSVAA